MQDNRVMYTLLEGKQPIWLPMLSGSMAPFLLPGDKLYINPTIDTFKSGNIVVFFKEGKFFSHRVIFTMKLKNRVLILEKGDANNVASFINANKALGRITKLKRNQKTFDLLVDKEEKKAAKTARKSLWHLIKRGSKEYIKGSIKKCINIILK